MGRKRYSAGIVGCGLISEIHANAVRNARDIELVALADVYEPNLQTAGAAYEIDRLYTNHRRMLESEDLDVVIVSTQTPHHARLVIDAADLGARGIICEKPIANDLAEADAMIAACDAAGAKLAINHQTRMIATTRKAEQLIQEGAIGQLRLARMLDKGGRPAGISILEMGTHLLDLLLLYSGPPSWVAGHLTVGRADTNGRRDPYQEQRQAEVTDIQYSQTGWPDRDCGLVLGDRCTATFGFAPRPGWHNGLTATFESFFQSVSLPDAPAGVSTWKTSLELIGTEGMLVLSGSTADLFLLQGPWIPPGQFEKIEVAPAAEPFPYGQQQRALVEDVLAAIEEDQEPRSSGRDGRLALEMIMGIYQSHRYGGTRVELPLALRRHPLYEWVAEAGVEVPSKPMVEIRTFAPRA